MTRISTAVDAGLLARLLAWTRGIEDIEEHHVADGLFIGAALRADERAVDDEALFLVGLVIGFWFWFDDRSDRFLCGPDTWDALIALGLDPDHRTLDTSPEVEFFVRLSALLRSRAGRPAEHRWWLRCSANVFKAMYAEEKMSRVGEAASYAQALEIGADSTGLTSIVSAANLAHGMDRAARGEDWQLARVERYMCLSQRLLNDLQSAEKERREGPVGRVSNLVLLLEGLLTPAQARAFAEAQYAGYDRLLQQAILQLGERDEFGKTIRDGMANIRRWYAAAPVRYAATPVRHAAEGGVS